MAHAHACDARRKLPPIERVVRPRRMSQRKKTYLVLRLASLQMGQLLPQRGKGARLALGATGSELHPTIDKARLETRGRR